MSANEVCHIRREQQLIPEDVRTREDYDDWLRALPRAFSEIVTAAKRAARKITIAKGSDDHHLDKAGG